MSDKEWGSLLKNVVPTMVEDLISVQPMAGPAGEIFKMNIKYNFDMFKYKIITDHDFDNIPEGHHIVQVVFSVGGWIEKQPIHMWKFWDCDTLTDHYIISDELLTLLVLKWT